MYNKDKLYEALEKRGFYHKNSVFCHEPTIEPLPNDSRYEYKIEIVKWNTSSSQVVILGARWDSKQEKYILSTYKTGSVKREKHGIKMR